MATNKDEFNYFSEPSSTGSSKFNKNLAENIEKKFEKEERREEKKFEESEEELEKKFEKDLDKKIHSSNQEHSQQNNTTNNSQTNQTPDTSDSQASQDKAQQNQEDTQARQEQYSQAKADLEAKKQEAIEKVKDWRDRKIEHVKSGPHGLVSFFTSPLSLMISATVDSFFGLIPIAGDIMGFFFNLTYWLIPFLLGGSFKSYFRVVAFYVVDLIVGLVGGTLANIIPVAGDAIVDAIPEIIVLTAMKKHSPHNVLNNSYEQSIPKKINAIDNKARKKIEAIIKATSDKEKALRKILQGKKPNLGVSLDGQKMITFVFALLILMMGPVSIFLPIGLPRMSLEPGSLLITGLLVLVLVLCSAFKFISQKHALGLGIFMVLNLLFTYLLQNTSFISQYLGNSTAIAIILLMIGGVLYVAALEGWMTTKQIGVIIIVLVVLISTPYLFSYLGSDKFQTDLEKSEVQAQGEMKKANLLTQIKDWIAEQRARGSGEIIGNGENEQTSEFIGVKIEDVSTYKYSYNLLEPVIVDISYSANSYRDITILTLCEIQDKNIQGDVEPKITYASETKSPRVRCQFTNLEKGYYNVDVSALYDYTSSTRIPIVFMEEEYANRLLYESKNTGGPTPAEKVGANNDKVITDSGPIYISASNAVEDSVSILKNPLVVDRENPNRYITPLKVQFPNFNSAATNSGIDKIKKAYFDLPEGLELYDCSFARGKTLEHTVDESTNRWIVQVEDEFDKYTSFQTIQCQLQINPNYIENFIPSTPGVEPWERHTIGFEVDYNYKIYVPGTSPFEVR